MRRVNLPSKESWSSKNRSVQLPQLNRRRIHTNVVRRPDTSKSRTCRSRVSCTLWHLNPQCGHRRCVWDDSTRTLNTAEVSSTTSNTRIWRRCNRTRITSLAIVALLDRWISTHRFQQGHDPNTGTLNQPAPHVYAQAQFLRI